MYGLTYNECMLIGPTISGRTSLKSTKQCIILQTDMCLKFAKQDGFSVFGIRVRVRDAMLTFLSRDPFLKKLIIASMTSFLIVG